MNKREAIQILLSVSQHFEYQSRERTYKVDGETKTYSPSESQIQFNLDQAARVNEVIDFLFDN